MFGNPVFFENAVEGLVLGLYMGIVAGPLAIATARMRIRNGLGYVFPLLLGGAFGDVFMASSTLFAKAFLPAGFDRAIALLHTPLAQSAVLVLLGTLLIVLARSPGTNVTRKNIPDAATMISLFAMGFIAPLV